MGQSRRERAAYVGGRCCAAQARSLGGGRGDVVSCEELGEGFCRVWVPNACLGAGQWQSQRYVLVAPASGDRERRARAEQGRLGAAKGGLWEISSTKLGGGVGKPALCRRGDSWNGAVGHTTQIGGVVSNSYSRNTSNYTSTTRRHRTAQGFQHVRRILSTLAFMSHAAEHRLLAAD